MVDLTSTPQPRHAPSTLQKSSGIAVLLALIIPGAGQMYAERIFRGIVVLIVTLLTVWILVGFVAWVYGMIDAYYLAEKWNEELERDPYRCPW